jgi:hypothetical protein
VKKALGINLLVSSTIFIGIAIGSLALATSNLEGVLLALTSGFFLHVVIHDLLLLPKGQTQTAVSHHIVLIIIGAGLMFGINTALGESHVHGGDHHDEHDHADHHEHEHHAEESHPLEMGHSEGEHRDEEGHHEEGHSH